MSLTRRTLLRDAGALVLLLGARDIAWGATILAVRVWPAEEYTRVTLESDSALQATHFLIDHPQRLVIDVDGLELSPTLRELVGKVGDGDPFIAGVRVGQNRPRVVRLVIDLKQATAPQVFTLEPAAAYHYRLVFDLYPRRQRDPLLALLQEEASDTRTNADATATADNDSRRAADAVNDALGDFIDKMRERQAAANAPDAASAPAPAVPSPPPKPPPPVQRAIDRLVIVAIDPGHGGEDPGATGPSGVHEKDVVLAIAKRLRKRINAMPNMRAMMTRDGDYFVPLHERVAKARRVQADLFISIHADAFVRPNVSGASVFALSERGASSVEARWIARKENAADLVGGANFKSKDATVARTLLDMSTTAQIKDSLRLGGEVLERIGKVGALHSAQVEQAGFAVLKAPDVPSILVETAFITNPREEAKLRSPAYQERLVEALADGVERYFAKNPPLARNRTL